MTMLDLKNRPGAGVFEFELASGYVTRTFPTAAGCEFIVAYQ